MSDLASRFFRRFAGLNRCYGRYTIPHGTRPDEKGKLLGPRSTVTEPVTLDLWERHLKGEDGFGVGITPIRDDATVVFGAIDVDVYPLNLNELLAKVRELKLPLMLCRTKSGGAHLYLFMSEPVSAELVRTKLTEWAALLGYPGVEIFPKQTQLANDTDTGSWINVPYNGGRRSTRYALNDEGKAYTPEEFLDVADRRALAIVDLLSFVPVVPPDVELLGDDFFEAPPCLQTLAVRGFGDWQNYGLYNLGVYLKKRHGAGELDAHLAHYNERFLDPPVPTPDFKSTVKSLRKKEYSYKCKEMPICEVCDKETCKTREFGVGGSVRRELGVSLGDLVKLETEPPTYLWDVNGRRIEITADELMNQQLFNKAVILKLDVWPNMIHPLEWKTHVDLRLKKLERMGVPVDATKEGQILVHLQRYCTSRVKGKALEELLMGKPYTDGKRSYFTASDFIGYLQQHRVSLTVNDLYLILRVRDLEAHKKTFKGKPLDYWSLPAFVEQTEDHDVPRGPEPERM